MQNLNNALGKWRRDPVATVGAAAAVTLVGLATRQLVVFGWRAVHGEDPPRDPARQDVAWPVAVGWTAAVGITVGLARLFARRSLSG